MIHNKIHIYVYKLLSGSYGSKIHRPKRPQTNKELKQKQQQKRYNIKETETDKGPRSNTR